MSASLAVFISSYILTRKYFVKNFVKKPKKSNEFENIMEIGAFAADRKANLFSILNLLGITYHFLLNKSMGATGSDRYLRLTANV
jgi:hypothetical protein